MQKGGDEPGDEANSTHYQSPAPIQVVGKILVVVAGKEGCSQSWVGGEVDSQWAGGSRWEGGKLQVQNQEAVDCEL